MYHAHKHLLIASPCRPYTQLNSGPVSHTPPPTHTWGPSHFPRPSQMSSDPTRVFFSFINRCGDTQMYCYRQCHCNISASASLLAVLLMLYNNHTLQLSKGTISATFTSLLYLWERPCSPTSAEAYLSCINSQPTVRGLYILVDEIGPKVFVMLYSKPANLSQIHSMIYRFLSTAYMYISL